MSSSPLVPPTTPQTGPLRPRSAHYGSPQPYSLTRSQGTPERSFVRSIPPSPYDGLSERQVEKLDKQFVKTDARVEFMTAILAKAGVQLTKEHVVSLVAEWADNAPEARSFSRLTGADFDALCKGVRTLNINYILLQEHVPDNLIPREFLPMLELTRRVSSRRTEIGARNVINLFLNVAVHIARAVFGEDRLVVHHEVQTDILEVPEVGLIHGPLEFLTARAFGDIPMGTCLKILLLICHRHIND
jgi:hypothetical protein